MKRKTKFTLKQRKNLIKTFIMRNGEICSICKKHMSEAEATIDHIHPLSLGGEDIAQNMQLAHSECNSKKGNTINI